MFFGMITVAFIVLRRIDYQKHVILKRIILTGFGVVAVSFVIIEALVFTQLGANDPEEADYVIILGSGIRGTELSLTLKQRLDASLDYIRSHPQTPVIVSGGQGPGESIPEALAMKNYLIEQGIPPPKSLWKIAPQVHRRIWPFPKKSFLNPG